MVTTHAALRAILWPDDDPARAGLSEADLQEDGNSAVPDETCRQLDAYFAGERTAFDLPFELRGTVFQQKAWNALAGIPFGETRSYAEQAALLGQPGAARAVGAANGRNPLSIVLPCHRVVAKNGSLTGFAGGLAVKRWLLEHEQSVLAARRT